jgi:hypothetical protein
MNISINERGTHGIYINDLICLDLDLPKCNNKMHSKAAPLLAIDVCSRCVTDDKPIPSHNMAALQKLSAEGRLEETKIILGWMWDFRRLTISLHINKYTVWLALISRMINGKERTSGDLNTKVRRLTHVSMIFPIVHHFMSHL